jgi:Polysaccharide lyase
MDAPRSGTNREGARPVPAGVRASPGPGRRLLPAAVLLAAAAGALVIALGADRGNGPAGTDPARGALIFRGDFETGNAKQWTFVQEARPDRFSVVRSPVRQGRFAGRFVSVAGECIPMDCKGPNPRGRTEALARIRPLLSVREGRSLWYRWYTLFPSGGPVPEFTFTQWRAADERSGPRAISGLYGLLTVGPSQSFPEGAIYFQRNGTRWSGPLPRGRWITFLMHVIYSSNARAGKYELWVDGRRVASFHDQSKPFNTGVYFKQGVYRNDHTPTGVAYFDGLRIATSRAVAVGR